MKKIFISFLVFMFMFLLIGFSSEYNIQVFSKPTSSLVFINDELVGTTPLKIDTLQLKKGLYNLKITKNNYKNIDVKLRVTSDMMLIFELQKKELTVEEKRKLTEKLIEKEENIIIIN